MKQDQPDIKAGELNREMAAITQHSERTHAMTENNSSKSPLSGGSPIAFGIMYEHETLTTLCYKTEDSARQTVNGLNRSGTGAWEVVEFMPVQLPAYNPAERDTTDAYVLLRQYAEQSGTTRSHVWQADSVWPENQLRYALQRAEEEFAPITNGLSYNGGLHGGLPYRIVPVHASAL